MTTRRQIILGAAAGTLLSLPVRAQAPARTLKLAFMSGASADTQTLNSLALDRGLRALGYVEGRNLSLARRFADGKYERLPALAAELVRLKPDIIVVGGGTAATVARKAITEIPVVVVINADPVASGLITNLARPGGNLTGLTASPGGSGFKRLELLHELAPGTHRISYLMNPGNPTLTESAYQAVAEPFSRKHNVEIIRYPVRTTADLAKAFTQMKRDRIDALNVPPDSFLASSHRQIAELAIAHRLPSAGGVLSYAREGGLAAFGANYEQLYFLAATYVDKIAKGARAGELAFAQAQVLETWVNQKTAAALGREIPAALLLRADLVIQ